MVKLTKGISLCISTILFIIGPIFAQIEFNDTEKEWIAKHDSIVLAVDNTYPPLNFTDKNGELSGLNIDLIKLVESRIGLTIILEGSNWDVALGKAMAHQVDGIINASALEERKEKLFFSEGLFRDPIALVSQRDNQIIRSLNDLENKKIAVKKNSVHAKLLKAKVPSVTVVDIPTLMDGVSLLSSNDVDGVYDDLAPLYHLLFSSNLSNLKIAFIEESAQSARVGVRNDDLVLLSILNKGILSIGEAERIDIQNKWFKFTPEKDYKLYYFIIIVLLMVVLIISLWSWSLRLVVKRRTAELKIELQQRKKTERELIKAKENAVESDKLKSAFLANMSHEIRTPLNSIIGFSGLLVDGELTSDEKVEHFNIITSSSNSLLSLINDIIDFSKIEAGYIETVNKPVSVVSVFTELMAIYDLEISKLLHEKEGLVFRIQQNDLLNELIVSADENRLKQVFSVLINNAIKFTNQGEIIVGAELTDDEMVRFYVRDTGIGIASDYHQVIFDRFRKIEDNQSELFRGAGLGLSIAKQLTVLMCGNMWVDSEPSIGSTFYFTLLKA